MVSLMETYLDDVVVGFARCSMEPHLCVPNGTYCQSSTFTCRERPYFLCTEALMLKGILLSKQYLRVASDRILCARKHLCSKARTVKQYFMYATKDDILAVKA